MTGAEIHAALRRRPPGEAERLRRLHRRLSLMPLRARLAALEAVDLPRSTKCSHAGAVVQRARQRGIVRDVEKALDAWEASS